MLLLRCDRCEKVEEFPSPYYRVLSAPPVECDDGTPIYTITQYNAEHIREIHLCKECRNELTRWLMERRCCTPEAESHDTD